MFRIYNKSSENMEEINDSSINLIIAGPPYNIGTKYRNFKDSMDWNAYIRILKNIFSECYRVLDKKGALIIESADTIFLGDEYVALSGLIQKICLDLGFSLRARHINFSSSKHGIELLEHDWEGNYRTKHKAHSNCHQFLVFSKSDKNFDFKEGSIHYSDYKSTKEHPCPFPHTHFFLLDKYFTQGMNVLDPFMGTANLGVEVIKRKGNYYGYELVKEFYESAQKKLKQIQN